MSYRRQKLRFNDKVSRSLNDSEARLLFKNTLQQAKAATETALNHTVTINSIVVPQHFSRTHSLSLLCEAAEEDGFVSQWHQVTPGLNGARLAYNLDSCAGLQLKPGQKCDIEDGPHFIMIVNYGRKHLSVAMVDIGLYICQPFNIIHFEQYGETSGSIVSHFLLAFSFICSGTNISFPSLNCLGTKGYPKISRYT